MVTRAPRELVLCVEVISALQFRLKLVSCTGSSTIVRSSLRAMDLVLAFNSPGTDIRMFSQFSFLGMGALRQSGVHPNSAEFRQLSNHGFEVEDLCGDKQQVVSLGQ